MMEYKMESEKNEIFFLMRIVAMTIEHNRNKWTKKN